MRPNTAPQLTRGAGALLAGGLRVQRLNAVKEVDVLITILEERPEDTEAIRAVNQKAFGQPQEGQLVDVLRENSGVLLSLVATLNGRVVGHILYSPVYPLALSERKPWGRV